MRYSLVLVTHGDNRQILDVIDAFTESVTPAPSEVWLFEDGPITRRPVAPAGWPPVNEWPGWRSTSNLGFCATYARAWALVAAHASHPYVFWLEHDFRIDHDLRLDEVADLLDDESVAQVSLERQPVNDREVAAGGLVAAYEPGHDDDVWWHRHYFTTNPSLMRRDFLRSNPWPDAARECEGHMGRRLIERGYKFATLRTPDRTPYAFHIGHRTGRGY